MSTYRITLERPIWMLDAPCADPCVDPDLWFPPPGAYPVDAKRICQACPHQQTCRSHALATGERHGVWGGLTEKERERILTATSAPRRSTPTDSTAAA